MSKKAYSTQNNEFESEKNDKSNSLTMKLRHQIVLQEKDLRGFLRRVRSNDLYPQSKLEI